MSRFIDADTLERTLRRPEFADYLKRTVGMALASMAAHLKGENKDAEPDFRM